jgi:peptidoglycan/LPS O-acetylase OafA/YrhL
MRSPSLRPKRTGKDELPALTGLRFIAAFSILFMHTSQWCVPFSDSQIFHIPAQMIGVFGMPLFFVLSGFVIHYNYGSHFHERPYSNALRNFLSARFARIYPLFLFFCVFGAISDGTADWISYDPNAFLNYILHSLTLTQSWVYKIVVNHRVLLDNGFGLGWSLSCEFFFYLAYTGFVFLILPIKRPSTNLIVIALFSALVICAAFLAYRHADQLMAVARAHVASFIDAEDDRSNSFYRWLFYYSPYMRIWEFVLGCLTAQLFLLLRDRPVSSTERNWGLCALYAALYLLLMYDVRYAMNVKHSAIQGVVNFFSMNFGCAVPIAVVIFCSARYRSPVTAFLSLPAVVWLGEISYSIYAVHTWTVRPFIRPTVAFNLVFGVDAVLRIAFAIAFTLIAATATYAIIEVPCRRYLRAKLMRSPAMPVPDAAPLGVD